MTSIQQGIPDLFPGRTDVDLEYRPHQVHYEASPDASVSSDIHKHVPLPGWREDP